MTVKLKITSDAWQNFRQANLDIATIPITVDGNRLNELLKPCRAYIKDLGDWFVYFETEEDLTWFKLKWS